MKKAVKVVAVALVLLVVLLVAGLFSLNRYVQSAAFQSKVLAAARDSLGSEVKVAQMDVSLFSGVTLKGVAIANPQGFPGDLLKADAFVLRYRLMPLLHKQLDIEEVSIHKPVIALVRNEKNEWNYDYVGGPPTAGTASGKPLTTPASSSVPLEVTLPKLAMKGGEVVLLNEKNESLVRIQNIDLSSSVRLTGNQLSGKGDASIELINVANSIFVRKFASPVTISTDEVMLSSLSGTLADGAISGDVTLKLTGPPKYIVNLQVKGSDVAKLLQEAGTKQVLNGKLQSTANLEGTGGLPTITGNGRAEIVGGTLARVPVQDLLATLLQVPALREIKFDECVLEFSMANNVMQTPVVKLTSPQVQITGKGTVSLDDYSLNHTLTLALAKDLLGHVPKEIRTVFVERADGFLTLDFKVWGPYDSPKTDLTDRLFKGATQQLLEKGLQNLFK